MSTRYDQRKPERLAEMERLAVKSVTSNPEFARCKWNSVFVLRTLYRRARGTGLITVPGGERSLEIVTGLTRTAIRHILDLLVDAGELKDVTPGERGSKQRRAHYAAGKQSEYRLRDHTLTGRKAATKQPAATVETTHGATQGTQSMGSLVPVREVPQYNHEVGCIPGYSPPLQGGGSYLIEKDHLTDGGGYGLGASATQQTNSPVAAQLRSASEPRSAVPDEGHALAPFGRSLTDPGVLHSDVAANSSAVDNSPVTANLPHRPPAGADWALVFRYDLPPLAREVYCYHLTRQSASVYALMKATGTGNRTHMKHILGKLQDFGLSAETEDGSWIVGDADPFTVHTAKATAKAAAVREGNRRHHEEQELIRAEFNEKREAVAPIVQSIEVPSVTAMSDDDNAATAPLSDEGNDGLILWNGLRILPEDLPPDERPLPSSNTSPVPRVLEEHPKQCDNKPMDQLDQLPAFKRLVESTRCRECGEKLPFGEEHIGVHFACEFPTVNTSEGTALARRYGPKTPGVQP